MPDYDVAIIGGGPVGLSLAAMLDAGGLSVVVIEGQAQSALANPKEDGRDIALTHRSLGIMSDLGVVDEMPDAFECPIRHARVLNGDENYSLHFQKERGAKVLGYLVPNHRIRRASYARFKRSGADLAADVTAKNVRTDTQDGCVVLSDGRTVSARLIVAADTRFSKTRQAMGIAARMRDFGRVCIVCRMEHEQPHDETAYECFRYDRTLAVLPMHAHDSSVVITLPADEAEHVMQQCITSFNMDVTQRFGARFGDMRLVGERYAYPLVAVYADRFYAQRFALVGDAAVGMHPVTAHGFNFGIMGARMLADELLRARAGGFGGAAIQGALERYSTRHRRATHPLYTATNALVGLYTDTRPPARIARRVLLHLGNIAAPARRLLTRSLTRTA